MQKWYENAQVEHVHEFWVAGLADNSAIVICVEDFLTVLFDELGQRNFVSVTDRLLIHVGGIFQELLHSADTWERNIELLVKSRRVGAKLAGYVFKQWYNEYEIWEQSKR